MAILNSLPMGFYAPAQDARKHGVEFLQVDVNYSFWGYRLAEKVAKYYKVHMEFKQIDGIREDEILLLIASSTQHVPW